MSLPKQEFIDRLVSHYLPKGFRRVRLGGIYATNQRKKLAHAKNTLAADREPPGLTSKADTTTTKKPQDQDSLEAEFSGDREGQATYRVRCQKCTDQPPMLLECHLSGSETTPCLSYIMLLAMFFKGKLAEPPKDRPASLPWGFGQVATDFGSPLEFDEPLTGDTSSALTTVPSMEARGP